ncbi:divergent polysaccharide deacetylase family protein [Candidatus Margulisiibacteriota bacterium]
MKKPLLYLLSLSIVTSILVLGWQFYTHQSYTWSGRGLQNGEAKVAIILDDVGGDKEVVARLLELPYPLTFSIIPRSTYAHELSQDIWHAGKEVMLHMPMEAKDKNLSKPYIIKLDKNMPATEIRHNLDAAMAELDFVCGINNHMGSAFTKNKKLVTVLMQYIRKQNIYFIDSRTNYSNPTRALARKWGVPYAARDVFLDDQPGKDYVFAQLNRLKTMALQNGLAIGIGHIQKKTTISALQQALPSIEEQGIKLVFVSEIVK